MSPEKSKLAMSFFYMTLYALGVVYSLLKGNWGISLIWACPLLVNIAFLIYQHHHKNRN